ncbi:hypothetical protein LOK49_LG03G02279 [Camellia lanceoleosa]|uniref:Uncharacterized protein n=1 Tax=Camellia lanceoleosa TaxID=1840588 RepID=A0ACC0IEW7_9ERIC|nr:hypothetical protein LOK49_LG03G02279 [Camellia lanceoleosa]
MLNQIQTLSSEVGHNNENEIEEEEVEKLEAEVKGMGEKIVEYRNSVPDQLKNALASTLVAQRPLLPTHLHHESLPQQSSDAGEPIELDKGHQLSEQDRETAEKTQLLKQKISSNVSALPLLLKRMKECISKIDNLQSSNEFIIHPAFKRKRTS